MNVTNETVLRRTQFEPVQEITTLWRATRLLHPRATFCAMAIEQGEKWEPLAIVPWAIWFGPHPVGFVYMRTQAGTVLVRARNPIEPCIRVGNQIRVDWRLLSGPAFCELAATIETREMESNP